MVSIWWACFIPLSCGSVQEVKHNKLMNDGLLKRKFTQRLPFRLDIRHSANVCLSSVKFSLQKNSPSLCQHAKVAQSRNTLCWLLNPEGWETMFYVSDLILNLRFFAIFPQKTSGRRATVPNVLSTCHPQPFSRALQSCRFPYAQHRLFTSVSAHRQIRKRTFHFSPASSHRNKSHYWLSFISYTVIFCGKHNKWLSLLCRKKNTVHF